MEKKTDGCMMWFVEDSINKYMVADQTFEDGVHYWLVDDAFYATIFEDNESVISFLKEIGGIYKRDQNNFKGILNVSSFQSIKTLSFDKDATKYLNISNK